MAVEADLDDIALFERSDGLHLNKVAAQPSALWVEQAVHKGSAAGSSRAGSTRDANGRPDENTAHIRRGVSSRSSSGKQAQELEGTPSAFGGQMLLERAVAAHGRLPPAGGHDSSRSASHTRPFDEPMTGFRDRISTVE